LNVIKHILSRYTAFLWALLNPLGIWGVFIIATLDGGAIGLPMDFIVAGYVYKTPKLFWLYALLASAGSVAGSSFLYLLGYFGGEKLLRKRMSPERFEKIHRSFDKHEFWALMFPAMLPPPTPFKLFVLSAAVFEMNFWRFIIAIFTGRFARFLLLSLLTIEFGPQFIRIVSAHLVWFVAGMIATGIVWWLVQRRKKHRNLNGGSSIS
jgi:membrane protein YqaA with SNARE-associated domain